MGRYVGFIILTTFFLVLPISSLAQQEGVSSCSPEHLFTWLRDDDHYAGCESRDNHIFRKNAFCASARGWALARACVDLTAPSCDELAINSTLEDRRVHAECENQRYEAADILARAIAEQLPDSSVVREIPDLKFSDERQIASELNDILNRSWPIGCSPTLSKDGEPETTRCKNEEVWKRLRVVSELAGLLHFTIGAF